MDKSGNGFSRKLQLNRMNNEEIHVHYVWSCCNQIKFNFIKPVGKFLGKQLLISLLSFLGIIEVTIVLTK